MTRHERRLASVLAAELGSDIPESAVFRLLERGLADMRAVERLAIRIELERLEHRGIPRCEAMHGVAFTYNCSYEKVRNTYYTSPKQSKTKKP